MTSDDDDFRRPSGSNSNSSNGGGGGGGGSRAEWHPDTVLRLIDGYADKCASIKGYLKTKDWEDIVKHVNTQCEGSKIPKTMKQCREKIDSLKRRYKNEKRRAELRGGSEIVTWSFFEKLDDIMRNLRRSGNVNVSEGQSFEITEALDFEAFDGEKGKGCMDQDDVLIDEGFDMDASEGFRNGVGRIRGEFCERGKKRVCDGSEGFDNGGGGAAGVGVGAGAGAGEGERGGGGGGSSMKALADALVSFSEIYMKIETAKLELFAKMNSELSKLQRRRRKKKKGLDSSVINSGDSTQGRASE